MRVRLMSRVTRNYCESHPRTLFVFTDNTDRTSGSLANIPRESWYYKKYWKPGMVLSYGTKGNPTSAVIRGCENAFPISTMRRFTRVARCSVAQAQWQSTHAVQFASVIGDELSTIRRAMNSGKFDEVAICRTAKLGQGSIARLPDNLQTLLDAMMKEYLGIDNGFSGKMPTRVTVYTAQIRYEGPDRLDITVKGKDPIGRFFAPSWGIVLAHKRGDITDAQYTERYLDMMRKSYKEHRNVWESILSRDTVTFVCYCPEYTFCHRYLLADIFAKLGAKYAGERSYLEQVVGGRIDVWTDGASKGNPGPSGFGAVLLFGNNVKEISGHIGTATSNVAELTAILEALKVLKTSRYPIVIHTDSNNAIGWLSKGWKMKARNIKALVSEINSLIKERSLRVSYRGVAAHSGIKWNERADKLASNSAKGGKI